MAGLASSHEDPFKELLERLRPLSDAERASALAGMPALDADVRNRLLQDLAPAARRLKSAAGGTALPAGTRCGAFEIDGLLGRSGMAEVYRVRRVEGIGEPVAVLKLLSREIAPCGTAFDAERQRLARLDHPHIARLLDGGVVDGRLYLVQEYVEGADLFSHVRERPLDPSQRLRLFVQAAGALAFAHARGVVHGDVKPSNLRVMPGGIVKLLDFGMPAVGHAILSPAYAAPEQLLGQAASPAADVYALGAILYQLLAGVPVLERRSGSRALAAAPRSHDAPLRPPSVAAAGQSGPPVAAHRLRGDLDAIVGRALQRDPSARYASVADLLADLRCHEDGAPVRARRGESLYALKHWLRQHRVVTAVGVLLLAMAGVGLGVA